MSAADLSPPLYDNGRSAPSAIADGCNAQRGRPDIQHIEQAHYDGCS
jgi:hypothetical protein